MTSCTYTFAEDTESADAGRGSGAWAAAGVGSGVLGGLGESLWALGHAQSSLVGPYN